MRCLYCGEAGRAEEHFPPRSASGSQGYLLSACVECNSIASGVHPYNFDARVLHVKEGLRRRLSRKLAPHTMGDDEWLAIVVKQAERIAWNVELYFAFTDHKTYSVLRNVDSGSITRKEPVLLKQRERTVKIRKKLKPQPVKVVTKKIKPPPVVNWSWDE